MERRRNEGTEDGDNDVRRQGNEEEDMKEGGKEERSEEARR